ncbi:hypothetical protein BDW22DRAFT_1295767, partial [Trametopsis cervina]
MRISSEEFKRVPTTREVLFGIDLPYRPPKNPIAAFIWRRRIWVEMMLGLSLLEPWEKVTILTFIYTLLAVTAFGLWKLMPAHISLVEERMFYY